MPQYDPEDRIADLERQLREARAVANPSARQFHSGAVSGDSLLADAPRRVPLRFYVAELLPFRWWYVFTLFLVAIPPIIVWIMQPRLLLPVAVLVVVVIYAIHVRTALTRLGLLRWGRVATVTENELLSQATYYGGTTYSNVVLPIAHGWTVTRPVWSGPKSKTRIRYRLDEYQGDLNVGGREYIDGVVLADGRKPERALCVTSFPYDLDRDESGNWTGRLRVRLVIGMICWLLILIGWVGGAALLYRNYSNFLANQPGSTQATHGPTSAPAPGAAVVVNGSGQARSIVCDLNDVTVNGAAETVAITGHCRRVTVSGSGNHVSVEVADEITANGIDNVVTFRVGSPVITNGGISNVIRPG